MGVLAGIGALSKGLSEGMQKGVDIRAKRAAAEKAEAEFEEAQAERDKKKSYETAMKGYVPGKTRVGLGGADVVYDAQQAQRAAMPVEQDKTGVAKIAGDLAGLFSKKSTDRTALASGLSPPGMPGPVGSPSGIAAAAAAPGGGLLPALAEGATTEEKVARGAENAARLQALGGPSKLADDIDAAEFRYRALAESGQTDKAIAEHQRYADLVAKRYLSNFGAMTPAEKAATMTQTTHQPHSVTVKDGLYTVTTTEKDANGKDVQVPIYSDVTEEELQAKIAQQLDASPELKAELANKSSGAGQKVLEARAVRDERAAHAKYLEAQTAGEAADTTETGVDTDIKLDAAEKAKTYDADFKRLGAPGGSILYPGEVDTFAKVNDTKFSKMEKGVDAEGVAFQKPYNTMARWAQEERAVWKNPEGWAGRGVVQTKNDPKLGPVFVVLDAHGQPVGMTKDLGEAYGAAVKMAASGAYGKARTPREVAEVIKANARARAKAGAAGVGLPAPGAKPPRAAAPPPAAEPPPAAVPGGKEPDLKTMQAQVADLNAQLRKLPSTDLQGRAAVVAQLRPLNQKISVIQFAADEKKRAAAARGRGSALVAAANKRAPVLLSED